MNVTIGLVAAMTKHRVIGRDNDMPWHLPADLQHFKATTTGKPVIMGRRTYQSIGRALPNRKNLVISRDSTFSATDVEVCSTPAEALFACQSWLMNQTPSTLSKQGEQKVSDDAGNAAATEVMVIGGGTIYQHFLPLATRLYLTLIDADIEGDTLFPDYHAFDWTTIQHRRRLADEKNQYDLEFVTLERASSSAAGKL